MKRARRVLTCLMALLLAVSFSTDAYAALTDLDPNNERIIYYDYHESCGPGGTDTSDNTGASADLSKVYIVGDSITVGGLRHGDYVEKLKAAGAKEVRIVGSGGGRLDTKGTDGGKVETDGVPKPYDNKAGFEYMREDKDFIKDATTVVIAHGTNGMPGGANDIQTAVDIVKKEANSNAQIFWVDIAITDGSGSGTPGTGPGTYHDISRNLNQVIYDNTSKGYSVISWAKAVQPDYKPESHKPVEDSGNPRMLADGIHPADYNKYTDVIVNGLKAAGSGSNNTNSGTIALDPGHNATDLHVEDPQTGADLYDYPNGKELNDMWDVAQKVKTGLEKEGYTVKMLRSSKDESVSFQERADRAKGSSMAVSIHSSPTGGSMAIHQFVGGHRDGSKGSRKFENADTAAKSKQYAEAMASARSSAEGGSVSVKEGLSFEGRGLAGGNLPWVQLLAPDTPWVYNEFQPSGGGGGGANGISDSDKDKYAKGIIDGIKAANISKGSGTTQTNQTQPNSTPPATQNEPNQTSTDDPKVMAAKVLIPLFDGSSNPDTVLQKIEQFKFGGMGIVGGGRGQASKDKFNKAFYDKAKEKAGGQFVPMIDEEGGDVSRYEVTKSKTAKDLGGMSEEDVKNWGESAGKKLKELGIEVDWAPVLDTADTTSSNSHLGAGAWRSFGKDKDQVIKKAGAFAEGLAAAGIKPTYKHFPGIGQANTNSDLKAVKINTDAKQKEIFKALASQNNGLVMMSNAFIDGSDKPASANPKAIQQLTGEVGFSGTIVSDDLLGPTRDDYFGSGAEISKPQGYPYTNNMAKLAVDSINAGTHLLLINSDKITQELIDTVAKDANKDKLKESYSKYQSVASGTNAPNSDTDTNSDACCGSGGGSGGSGTITSGGGGGGDCGEQGYFDGKQMSEANMKQIWSFFKGKGLSDEAVSGIMGNAQIESAFMPDADNGRTMGFAHEATGRGCVGIFQWCDRRPGLESFAKERGKDWTCLGSQLEFAWHEIEGAESGVLEPLKATKTPGEAARVWNTIYERSGEVGQNRIEAADAVYKKFTGSDPVKLNSSGTAVCATKNEEGGGGAFGQGIVEAAKEMASWSKAQTCYAWGGGHGTKEDLDRRIEKKFSTEADGVDCSGFARAAIYKGTGKDPGPHATQAFCEDTKLFEKIPRAQAKPGDLSISCQQHVSVILEVKNGKFATADSMNSGCGTKWKGPALYDENETANQGSESFVLRYKG